MSIRRLVVVGSGLFLTLGTLGFWALPNSEAPPPERPLSGSEMAMALQLAPPATGRPPAPSAAAAANPPAIKPVQRHSVSVIAGQEPSEMLMFHADERGRLVVDETTRLDVEKLFALNEPAERQRKQRALLEGLPPEAARELAALMVRYDNYKEAQYQQLPPGQPLQSREDAIAQFERLRALRVQYFGAPLAQRLFGHEEAQQADMLAHMDIDPRPE